MRKGNYVVMISNHTTSCGKEYLKGHIGCLAEDINEVSGKSVDVRFPIHRKYDSSWIPRDKFILADDQYKAEKLFKQGEELCKKVFYK